MTVITFNYQVDDLYTNKLYVQIVQINYILKNLNVDSYFKNVTIDFLSIILSIFVVKAYRGSVCNKEIKKLRKFDRYFVFYDLKKN